MRREEKKNGMRRRRRTIIEVKSEAAREKIRVGAAPRASLAYLHPAKMRQLSSFELGIVIRRPMRPVFFPSPR